MTTVVTLKGIEEAVANLDYRNLKGTKSRLVQAIRAHYERDDSIETVKAIDSDKLIRILWENALDPVTIRNRRRNLSSIKSSVNSDLKRLYREGKNPEGIIISSLNTFVMSDEAKDSALEALSGLSNTEGGDRLHSLASVVHSLKEALSSFEDPGERSKNAAPAALHELQDLIRDLSGKLGITGMGPDGAGENDQGSFGGPLSIGEGRAGTRREEGTAGRAEGDVLSQEALEAEAVVEEIPDDSLESVEEAEEELEEIEAEEAAFDDEDLGAVEPEPEDEILEVMDEEEDATGVEEVEEAADADVLEPLEEEEFEDADLDEEVSEIEPADEFEELEDAQDIEAEGVEILEEADPEAEFEEIDGEELEDEDVELADESEALDEEFFEDSADEEELEVVDSDEALEAEDVVEETLDDSLEGVEDAEEELEEIEAEEAAFDDEDLEEVEPETLSLESDGGILPGVLEVKGGVGGGAEGLEYADGFREETLLADAEESGRLMKDFGDENLDGGSAPSQNADRSRVLAEQFNRSLAAMDRFFNQYVQVPAGRYSVGKKRPAKGERVEQIIELPSFYMGKFPVTNALFEVFIEKTGYKTTAERVGYGTVYDGRVQRAVDEETGLETYTWSSTLTNKIVKGACWYQPLGPGSTLHKKRNHPVVQVSLEDARAFAAWTGKGVPTEEEWEAASRTARGYPLPWGRRWKREACNFEDSSIGATTPVDLFVAWENELGIADTLGNVWEWTLTPFENGTESNAGSYISKGGSWATCKPLNLATRFRVDPTSHSNILGFRCVAY